MNRVRENKLAILIFILPATVLFATIIIAPIFMSGYYSLFDWNGITEKVFMGIQNYIELFTSPSIGFVKSLRNVILFTVMSLGIQLPFSLLLALLLSKKLKGERFFVSVFFIPVLMSTVVIGQLWMKIYNPDYGIVNTFLRHIGLESWCKTWLGDQKTALVAVLIPMLWQYVGYHMLLMYAGIKSLNSELIEAAKIDGATDWQTARFIQIPLIKPVLRVCAIFSVVGSLKAFDLIYVLTNGGPARASEVPSTLMVNMIFVRDRYGLGSAVATLIIFLCFFFAIITKKVFRVEEE